MQWHQEPLLGFDWVTETIGDGQVDLGRAEQAVEEVFHACSIKVVQLICSDYFHVGQEIGCVLVRAGDAGFHLAPGYANFVDKLTVLGNKWMI